MSVVLYLFSNTFNGLENYVYNDIKSRIWNNCIQNLCKGKL